MEVISPSKGVRSSTRFGNSLVMRSVRGHHAPSMVRPRSRATDIRMGWLGVGTRVSQLMHFTRGHAWALMCKTRWSGEKPGHAWSRMVTHGQAAADSQSVGRGFEPARPTSEAIFAPQGPPKSAFIRRLLPHSLNSGDPDVTDALGCGAFLCREGVWIYALHQLPFVVDRTALKPSEAEPGSLERDRRDPDCGKKAPGGTANDSSIHVSE
jgi:hypothetical protein